MHPQISPKLRIFILDDDPDILTALTSLFESENFHVQSATDAYGLYQRLLSFKPDIILIDVILKEDNGGRISQMLKADTNLRHIPIILMSRVYNFHQQTSSSPLFADDYIDKPFTSRHILEKVMILLNNEA
ncbi:PleD family two-component system response regulator [Pedobacter aquatilis]|uniref:response regulator n=1 Tax=Pedobacter aquatilis TaxID=351343 RepID=UPI00292CB2C4|nr:response regulator [Pedobacter aquatilis]